ncbi:MAG TPA: TetR/AcrR family transcriptional regulator [Acidiferrobacteraceae bacterium]|nr:TetR/AcrR family transcriptional regulator [Acidiferrobacteraceae bacterium]
MTLTIPKSRCHCRWRRRKEARPEEIVEAALALFVEKGFSATRMAEVAKQAGISKGTLYLYFDSKEKIFHAVIQHFITPMIDEVETLVKNYQGSTEALIKQLVHGWWGSIWNTPLSGIPKLVISEAGNFPDMARFYMENVVKRVRSLLEQIIQTGVQRGEFRDVDIPTVTRLLMAPIIQINIWAHSLRPYDDPQDGDTYINLHIDLFLQGLKKHGQNT